jgi:hypothetical protein
MSIKGKDECSGLIYLLSEQHSTDSKKHHKTKDVRSSHSTLTKKYNTTILVLFILEAFIVLSQDDTLAEFFVCAPHSIDTLFGAEYYSAAL